MAVKTIGTTAGELLPANAARQNVYIRNNSAAAQIVYVANVLPGGLVAGNAMYIMTVGEWISFNIKDDGFDLRQPWSAVASAAGASIVVSEMSSSRSQLAEEAKNP